MQRTLPAFVSLVALVVAAAACGSGGGGTGGSWSNAGSERPTANGWDPFAAPGDSPQSGAELPGCAGQTTATPSQILEAVRDPICTLAATCPPVPATNSPGQDTQDMSEACSDILDLDSISDDINDDGIRGVCQMFDELIKRLKAHPECDPPIKVPDGVCLDAVRKCLNEVVSFGCSGAADVEPESCKGISFGSDDEPPPTGQGGQGQGGQGYGGSGYGGSGYGGAIYDGGY